MTRISMALILLATGLMTSARAADVAPAPADVIRIPIECEDMRGVTWGPEGFTPAWTAGRWGRDLHQNMVFGGAWASRMAAAVTDAGDKPSEVFQDVSVPEARRYKIWAKYECPPFFNYPFGIRIQPLDADGKPAVAIFDKVFGLRESAKHFSFEKKLRTGDLYWNWGIDHDAAEGYETDLPAGRVRVTLYKAAGPAGAPVGARSVDAILITSRISELSAPEYPRFPLLDELQQANHLYVRFRNTGSEPVVVNYNHWNHRADHYYAMDPRLAALVRFYDAWGCLIADAVGKPRSAPGGQWADPIAPGQSSPWIDVGPTISPENSCPFHAQAKPSTKRPAPAAAPELPLAMDLALKPREASIVKSFEKGPGEPELSVLIQPDLHRPEGKDWTLPVAEVYRRVTRELDQFKRVGPSPKKLRLYGGIGLSYPDAPLTPQRPDFPVSLDYAIALGLNTMPGEFPVSNALLADAAVAHFASKNVTLIEPSGHYHHTQDPAALAKMYPDEKSKARLYYDSFGDEIGLPHIDVADPKLLADFRQFLTDRGIKPADLGKASMDDVKPLPTFSTAVAVQIGVLPKEGAGPATMPGRGGWEVSQAALLALESVHDRAWHQAPGPAHRRDDAPDRTALQNHRQPRRHAPLLLDASIQFYRVVSRRGDDVGVERGLRLLHARGNAPGGRVSGRISAHGAKYHDTPMMYYCMPHYPGNTGQHVVQNAVLLWGQGVRDLDFFGACPDAFATENYIHSRGGMAETGRGIRQISGMAGNIEDDLLAVKTKKARVAILLSEASDVWETGGQGQGVIEPGSEATNVSQEERKAIWYCLRNHGYLVDLLSENDVAEGRLEGYAALYACGRNLDRRTANPIRQWVEAGGRLFLTVGACRRDQYDEPFTDLDSLIGRGEAVPGGAVLPRPIASQNGTSATNAAGPNHRQRRGKARHIRRLRQP